MPGSEFIPLLCSVLFLASGAMFHWSYRLIRRFPDWNAGRAPVPEAVRSAPKSELMLQLSQAGFHFAGAEALFQRVKLISGLLFFVAGFILALWIFSESGGGLLMPLMFAAGLGLLGFFAPVYYVDIRRRNYRKRIRKAVPDALDFLQVSVEAGQSIDAGLLRVTQEISQMHPDLARGLRELTDGLAAGADRPEAFARLALETESDEIRQFATVMTQAAKMGTPIGHTLKIFAADLRDQRIRETEAKANVLPTKMTLGSMMFTVPPLLILLLAPSVLRIMGTF